ncbi:MAG: hypothetical protein S0880_06905 [Actinomycetota bacterium]|nr:hypothetical protein [Actinomycetota bacterium]
MRAVDLPVGLATSVGPLPHADPAEACAYVLDAQPGLPALPSVPNRSLLDRRIAQAAWGIPGVHVMPDGSVEVDHDVLEPETPFTDREFAGAAYETLHRFLDAVADRQGPAKFQLTGPVSLGIALHAVGVDRPRAFAAARTVVRTRAAALLDLVERRAPGVTPVVFVDEPGMRSCLDPEFPVGPNDALDLVSTVLAVLERRAITALRCGPGGPADWQLLLQAGPQILCVPLDGGIEHGSGSLTQFVENGGWIAWAAIPTSGPIGSSGDRPWRQLADVWCELVTGGCDPVPLRTQAIVMPTTGLGTHTIAQATEILDLTAEIAGRVQDQATGIRLTVGA